MAAHIEQVSSGEWRLRYRDADGKHRERYFPTRGEAHAFLASRKTH
jgi:hypothetical protein